MNLLPTLMGQITTSRTYFEWMRLRQFDQWWHWLLLAIGCLLVLTAVTTMYWWDARGLGRGKRWLLLLLRVVAFVGILVFFLDLQKRTEQKLIKNSRVALLVDTSQSMGIADLPGAGQANVSRIDQVVETLSRDSTLAALRDKHDVLVYRFDETNQPSEIAMFPQAGGTQTLAAEDDVSLPERIAEARGFWTLALAALTIASLALISHFTLWQFSRTAEGESWALLVGVFFAIVGVVLIAVSNLRHDVGMSHAMGWAEPATEDETTVNDEERTRQDVVAKPVEPAQMDWSSLLTPRGGSTRLGDAVNWILAQERGNPLAGIGVFTDGNSNRGMEIRDVALLCKEAEVPVYAVGIASDLPPVSVRIVDVEAPARVYPGDEFKMTGYVQAYGLAGQTVNLQMTSRNEGGDAGEATLDVDLDLELGTDGEVIPVPMQVRPEDVGKRVYTLRLAGAADLPHDVADEMSVKIRVVDRKSRVLLLAGGPTREYRFVRNMLFRDRGVQVDVLLQTAVDGISQEADDILFDLPRDAAQLFDYDTIVAFDPDWLSFDQTQLELLEQWVAEKAGGMVVVSGPVHTASWAEDRRAPSRILPIRQLYPVTFNASRIELGRYGNETAWPIELSADGRGASFLQLSDTPDADAAVAWSEFAGVYGFYPVREVKPAATVFARYSDPQVDVSGTKPPLIVGQFYGAGRVVFLGTGEFWRLRATEVAYFERFYTKLIRYVAEGRLLRDSNRGLLLVEKDRAMRGDTIGVRASVVDAQFVPLQDPSIELTLRRPDRSEERLTLSQADDQRDGMYAGRFMASQVGDYQIELLLPGDVEPVVLEREVRVSLPNLEIERPQRNDTTLTMLAEDTGGQYYVGVQNAMQSEQGIAARLTSKRRETYLPGTPDRTFQLKLRTWLLACMAGALSLEWLIRRLSKLA